MFDIVAYEGLKERFFRQVKKQLSQLKAGAASLRRGERRLQNGRTACWRSGLPVWDGEADTSGGDRQRGQGIAIGRT